MALRTSAWTMRLRRGCAEICPYTAAGVVVEAVADVICPAGSSRPVSTLMQAAETTNTATAPAPIRMICFHTPTPGRPLTRGRFNVIAVIRTPNTANTLALRSSRDLGFRRPVRPGACIGLGTDRTMSITALRCEGSHTNGRVGDGLVWPRRDTRPELVGVRIDPAGALPSGVLGRGNRH